MSINAIGAWTKKGSGNDMAFRSYENDNDIMKKGEYEVYLTD